jgi:peptidoglycan hydrolase-like protein with peptidoglycan-binding domain
MRLSARIFLGVFSLLIIASGSFVAAAVCPALTRTLQLDDHGNDVKALQQFLAEQYFFTNTPDGYFDIHTQDALRHYQSTVDIVSSGSPATTGWGITGPKTRAAIAACKKPKAATPSLVAMKPLPVVPPAASQTPRSSAPGIRALSRGMSGDNVRAIQVLLIRLGLLPQDSATGFFGPLTEAAVKKFQSTYGIASGGTPATTGYGVVGPRTLAALASSPPPSPPANGIESNTNTAAVPSSQCPLFTIPQPKEHCPLNGSWQPLMSATCMIGWRCSTPDVSAANGIAQSDAAPSQPISSMISQQAPQPAQSAQTTQQTTQTSQTTQSTQIQQSQTLQSCMTPWGAALASGVATTSYQSAAVAFGQSCVSELRTCTDGSLSGSYRYPSCVPAAPLSCTIGTLTLAHGQSKTFFSAASVVAPAVCQSQDRTCTNGALSGDASYQYASCAQTQPTATAQASCTLDGQTFASGTSRPFYSAQSVSFGSSCNAVAQMRTCTNGSWDGGASFKFSACTPAAPLTCTAPWGAVIAHGASVTANQSSSVPYGSQCLSETRTCSNGTLSGSYQYQSCGPAAPASCMTPWGVALASGAATTSYQAASVAAGQQCASQMRTCTNGVLSGTYQYASCSVAAMQSCANGLSIAQYPSCACPSGQVQSGNACVAQTPSTLCPIAPLAGTSQDASSAIQSCINGAGTDGIVDLPTGIYTLAHELTVNQPITLRTYGKRTSEPACSISDPSCAQLLAASTLVANPAVLVVNATSINIDHLILDGNKDARRSYVPSGGTYLDVAVKTNCNNCSFTNSVFKNALKAGGLVIFGTGSNTTFSNNTVAYSGIHDQQQWWSDGFDMGDGKNDTLTNNTFIDNTDGDVDIGGCTSCTITGNSITHTGSFRGSSFSAMVFQGFMTAPGGVQTTSGDFSGSDISHNTINCGNYRCGFGIYLGLRPWGYVLANLSGGSFHDNTITGAQQGIAIDSMARSMRFYNNTVTSSGGSFLVGTVSSGWLRATSAYNVAAGAQVDFSGDSTPASSYTHELWDAIPNWYTNDWTSVSGAGPVAPTPAPTPVAAPSAPASLNAACNTNGTATFNWTPSSGATEYYLFVRDTTAGQYLGANSEFSYGNSANPTTITVPAGHAIASWVYAHSANGQSPATQGNVVTCTAAAAPVSNAIDIFLIAGQSNAVGAGTVSLSPRVPSGKVLQYYNGAISDANDPVGNAFSGSAWPSFGIQYYNSTGHLIAFVPAALGSTGLTAAADTGYGNWSPAGTLFNASIMKLNAGLSALSAAGYSPQFKGVLWDQGENDTGIAESTATYQTALTQLINNYRASYGASMPFYIFRTGAMVGILDDTNWQNIRQAQDNVAAAVPRTYIVFTDAINFLPPPSWPSFPEAAPTGSNGFKNMMASTNVGELHYSQLGYNEMGTLGAQAVVATGNHMSVSHVQTANLANALTALESALQNMLSELRLLWAL